jgi:hypothetical protein
MRKAEIKINDITAGILIQNEEGYHNEIEISEDISKGENINGYIIDR